MSILYNGAGQVIARYGNGILKSVSGGSTPVSGSLSSVYGMTGLGSDADNPLLIQDSTIYRIRAGINGATLKDSFNSFVKNTNDNSIGIIEQNGFVETNLSWWGEGNKVLVDRSPNGCIFRNLAPNIGRTKTSNVYLINITVYSDDNRASGDAVNIYAYDPSTGWDGVQDLLGSTFIINCDFAGSSDEVLDVGRGHGLVRIRDTRIWGAMGSGHYGFLFDPQEHYEGADEDATVIMERVHLYRNQQRNGLFRGRVLMSDCLIHDPGSKMVEVDTRANVANNPTPYAANVHVINTKTVIGPSYSRGSYLSSSDKMIHCSAASDVSGNKIYSEGNKVYDNDGNLITSADIISNSSDSNFTILSAREDWYNDITITDSTVSSLMTNPGTDATRRQKSGYIEAQYAAKTGGLASAWSDLGGFPTTNSNYQEYDLTNAMTVDANGMTNLYKDFFNVPSS